MIEELILKNRTIRRYDTRKRPSARDLEKIIAASLNVASAANRQRLRYAIVTKKADEMFSAIKMGGYLPEDKKPTYEVRPTAYIVILTAEKDDNLFIDMGIAAQAITLVGCETGLGCCMIRSFDRKAVTELLGVKEYSPELVIALGYPLESARVKAASGTDDVKYYKDEDGVNVVPKISLNDALIASK